MTRTPRQPHDPTPSAPNRRPQPPFPRCGKPGSVRASRSRPQTTEIARRGIESADTIPYSLRQEIGLGDAGAIERLEVYWPTSATLQVFEDVPMGTTVRIVEGRDGYETVVLPRFDLMASGLP